MAFLQWCTRTCWAPQFRTQSIFCSSTDGGEVFLEQLNNVLLNKEGLSSIPAVMHRHLMCRTQSCPGTVLLLNWVRIQSWHQPGCLRSCYSTFLAPDNPMYSHPGLSSPIPYASVQQEHREVYPQGSVSKDPLQSFPVLLPGISEVETN